MSGWLDPTLLSLGLVVGIGAFTQSSIGFGTGVIAAPVIVMLRPDLMPAALLVCTFVLPMVQLASVPREISWSPLSWALVGRLLGTPLGVLLVARTSTDAIALAVGVLILVTVAASLIKIDIPVTRGNSFAAGAVSGVSGASASIGGPFLALVLQHEAPNRLRATLAVFFVVGTAMALGGLVIAGEMTGVQLRAGLLWLPFAVVGHFVAGPVRSRLPAVAVRRGVLTFCVVASVSVIVRTVI